MSFVTGGHGLLRQPVREQLPYENPFSLGEQKVIENAIADAMRTILASRVFNPASVDEEHITEEIVAELNRMLESDPSRVAGFSKKIFQTVIRGGASKSFDGSYLEKRPDLTFRPQRRLPGLSNPDYCALFVECKLVDGAHPMHLYANKGIMRFVEGKYAWAVSTGMMLGYARHGYTLPGKLQRHFESKRASGNKYELVGPIRRRDEGTPSVFVTIHGRSTVSKIATGEKGHIHLLHLWLPIG